MAKTDNGARSGAGIRSGAGAGPRGARGHRAGSLIRLGLFVAMTGALLYGVLSLVPPQYRSLARIYVEPVVQVEPGPRRDVRLVTAQIKALRSKELIAALVEKNALTKDPDFNPELARPGLLNTLAARFGFGPEMAGSDGELAVEQRVQRAVLEAFDVRAGRMPGMITVAVRSSEPEKSARLANDLAGAYINRLNTHGAGKRDGLNATGRRTALTEEKRQIKNLRESIMADEAELAALRADLRDNPVMPAVPAAQNNEAASPSQIGKEQMSDLVSRHILARADRVEAELRAKLVRDMLNSTGELHGADTVLNSGLVQKLLVRRAKMERRLADLEVTLLPSHPQLKRLVREMNALKAQIRSEAQKAVVQLESEAEIALAREQSLRESLTRLQQEQRKAAPEPVSPVKPLDGRLAQISTLETRIDENRQKLAAVRAVLEGASAGSRAGIAGLPVVRATLVARAVAAREPVFPKKRFTSLAGMLAAFVLGLLVLLVKRRKRRRASHGGRRREDRLAYEYAA